MSNKNRVFLSLPSGLTLEKKLADSTKTELERLKFGVFYFERNLSPGDNFSKVISEALSDSQVMVAFLSDSFLNSAACIKELKYFSDNKKRIVIVPTNDRIANVVESDEKFKWMRENIQWSANPFSDSALDLNVAIQKGALEIVTTVVAIFNTMDTVEVFIEKKLDSSLPIFTMATRNDLYAVEIGVVTYHSFFPAYFVVCFDRHETTELPSPRALQPETNNTVYTIAAEEPFRQSLGDKANGKEIYVMAARWPLSHIFKIVLPIYYSSKSLILSDVFLHVPKDGTFETHYVGALNR